MKKITAFLLAFMLCVLTSCSITNGGDTAVATDININQLGYYPENQKLAIVRGESIAEDFNVIDAKSGEAVFSGRLSAPMYNKASDETVRTADFSQLEAEGCYYIENSSVGKSHTFTIGKEVYNDSFNKVMKMFYLQRCGEKLKIKHAKKFHHPACHTELATVYETGERLDVSGGWHDAGDYGRYTVAAAKSVTDLMLAYRRSPEKFTDDTGIPESKNGIADILDEVKYELEWMQKMQRADGGVYHKVTVKEFPGVIMPQKEAELFIAPVSTTATGDFAGAMAVAYMVYEDVDSAFAAKCLEAAELSWNYLEQHKNFEYKNIDEIATGEYGDYSDLDERYFASAALFAASGEDKYADAVKNLLKRNIVSQLGWQSMGAYGSYLILTSANAKTLDKSVIDNISSRMYDEAQRLVAISEKDGYMISLDEKDYAWGSNMGVANNAMLLIMMNDISPDENYIRVAKNHLDYIYGRNPMAISYVTQTGSVSPQNPHHRPSQFRKKAMPGMLVGGPDFNLDDDFAKAELKGMPPAKCYIDNEASYSTNEITIYWNSPLVFLMSEYL